MSEPLVLRDDENGVTTLTLNRPDKLNALNPAVFVEFRAHLDAIADDGPIKIDASDNVPIAIDNVPVATDSSLQMPNLLTRWGAPFDCAKCCLPSDNSSSGRWGVLDFAHVQAHDPTRDSNLGLNRE